jgi:uncharacterized protein
VSNNSVPRETVEQLLSRYVRENTYSFEDFEKLDVNSVGKEGETPLHMAVTRGALQDVVTLLAAGANVNARTEFGWTPLGRSPSSLSIEILKVLLLAGADIHAKSEFGDTPMTRVIEDNRPDLVELFKSYEPVQSRKDEQS